MAGGWQSNARSPRNRRGFIIVRRFTLTASLLAALTGAVYLGALGSSAPSVADEDDAAMDAAPAGARTLLKRLEAARPDLMQTIRKVSETPVANLYAVELAGGTLLYGTADGGHLIAGDLYALGDGELVNLAEEERSVTRRRLLESVDHGDMIVFAPKGEVKGAINVFTDVDCGYCQMLHREVPELNARGIEVRYLAYPRAGLGSDSYRKIVSAWCAKNPQDAITRLKAREAIPEATCQNPVADQYALGGAMGVTGTPAIVLDDGRLLPGYLPADRLSAILGI